MKALKILLSLCLSFAVGAIIGQTLGVSPILTGVSGSVISLIPRPSMVGMLSADLFPEIWTGILIKKMRDTDESLGWFKRLTDMSQYANYNVIHMIDVGIDPDVLINNTSYPLEIQDLEDGDVAITLDKYQTKPTRVTDDELHNLSYDKKTSVVERHKQSFERVMYSKAIHSIAPAENTTNTPVLLTTGPASEDGLRNTLIRKDIITLKEKFDKLKYPTTGRILVLCADHVSDLLNSDQKFADQYHNYTTGKILNMYGFDVYEYQENPYFKVSDLTKLPYGTPVTSDYTQASVAFYEKRVMKAKGETKAYLSDAADHPETQENLISFRHYFIALPVKLEGIAAIASNLVAGAAVHSITADQNIVIKATGTSATRTVATVGGDFTAEVGDGDWFSVAKNGSKFVITTTANTEAERTGTVVLTLIQDPETKLIVNVTQQVAE